MNKKSLLIIALMALFAPLGMFGQQPAVIVDGNNPFFDNFEGAECEWEFTNGDGTNAWWWGTVTCNGGTHSVYVSNDGGTSNAYSNYSNLTWVYFWKLITIEEGGTYRISYDWRNNGNGDNYLRVGLLPESATLTAGSQYPTSDWVSLDGGTPLYGNTNWTTKNSNETLTAGTYKLVFAWYSYYWGSVYNPAAAVDNVGVTKFETGNHTTYVTQTHTQDFMKGTGSNVRIANGDVALQYKMESVSDWSATTNLIQTLKDHQVVTWHNYVYCVGGYNGSSPVSNVYRATQQTSGISSWSEQNALPVALKDMAVIATQTQLIVAGGRNNDGVSDKIYSAALNDNGSIGTWQELPVSLPQACWGARLVEVMGHLYIIGGANTDTENDATDKVYRLTLNAWGEVTGITEVTSLPEARNGHAATVYNSKIIVTGGYDATFTQKNTVYTAAVNLDGSLGSWETNTALPNAIYGHTTLCTNGILTLIGGKEGDLESNKFFYTDADATTYNWRLSDITLSERYTEGASFAFDNKIFYCGGVNLSGNLNNAVRYMVITPSTTAAGHPVFVSWPFNVGTPKQMVELNYNLTNSAPYAYEVLYRTADEDKVFSNWTSAGSETPVTVGQTKRYIQYMFRITATGEDDFTIEDVTLTLSGYSQLAGNLNYIGTLTAEGSPYLVTEDISFNTGTHNIAPSVTILFMPNTGLNIGAASVNFNGTEESPILLTAYEGGSGSWNGVYFQDASDNSGLASTMQYTTIEKAGNGDNESNLRLRNTNQPTISHCSFNLATTEGVWLQSSNPTFSDCTFDGNKYGIWLTSSSPACTSCTMSNNTNDGIVLNNSAPTITNCTMTGNGNAGIYFYSENFNATFSGVICSNNTYGYYSCTPNRTFNFDSSIIAFADNTADIAVGAGTISSNQTWNYFANGYALLGTVYIYGNSQPKLTIVPGNTIKVQTGYYLCVGSSSYSSSNGGQLYAVGTAEQPITFTSLNGEVGGWGGLEFLNSSDYNSTSSLRYCVLEKAGTNLGCYSTNQPSVMWCTLQDASSNNVYLSEANISIEGSTLKNAPRGLTVTSSSNPTMVNVVFENHSQACVRYNSTNCTITYNACTMKDSQSGICYATPNIDIAGVPNVTFQNNVCNFAVLEGTINGNRTWAANTYAIFGNVNIYNYNNLCSLTLAPGSTLMFDEGKQFSIESRGSLVAEGTAEQPITFTSLNGQAGGWNGIYFADNSDGYSGQGSSLKHCIVENGNDYNLYLLYTTQPSLIEDCTFQNAVGKDVYLYQSYSSFNNCTFRNAGTRGVDTYNMNGTCNFTNCSFEDNGDYPLYFSNAAYMGSMTNTSFTGNNPDAVLLNEGTVSATRTWEGYTYHILGNLYVGNYYGNSPSTWTLMPGATLMFAEGKGFYTGSSTSYCANIIAEGTAEQPITFTSMNGQPGGWNGLYFGDYSDYNGRYALLKHCVIENGNEYNLKLYYTYQPTIESCTFSNSNGYGLWFDTYSSPTVSKSTIRDNASYGIYANYYSYPTIGGTPERANSIYNNGDYAVYLYNGYNSNNTINMKYNFWGNIGTQVIDDELIYDKMDNNSLSRVNFEPVSWFPIDNFEHLQGTFTYNGDAAKLMANRQLNIVNTGDTIVATAATNGEGTFDFSNYAVEVYNTLDTLSGIDILAGVNATDALLAMRHFVHLDTLVGNYAAIADVNVSGSINGTDAMLIMRRSLGQSFPAGDFYFFSPNGISINGSTCTYDLSFLCYGDVNGSYNLQTRDNTIELMTEGQLMAESYQEYELPVNIKNAVEMGALTLYFNYPEEYLEIEDVVLAATGESLLFAATDGKLSTAWYSLVPAVLNENDVLINIKVQTKDLSNIDEPVAFSMGAYSELADGTAQVIDDVVIAMPEIVTATMGMSDNTTDGVHLSTYPNPAKDVCTLVYQLPEVGRVTVSVYNLMGEKVMDAANFRQEEGQHEIRLNTSALAAGMYCCRITFEGENSWVKTTMLIIEK